jgi:uncharacterized membrane protein YkgB
MAGTVAACRQEERQEMMNKLTIRIANSRLFRGDADNHILRVSMAFIYLIFGYQKWQDFDVPLLAPFFMHGPLIFWMYPVFGARGATHFLGASEWLLTALLLIGFWNKQIGVLAAFGSVLTFLCTATIIPFFPEGWQASAGGFPAMTPTMGFLMKDVVLLAASFSLLSHDIRKLAETESAAQESDAPTVQRQTI